MKTFAIATAFLVLLITGAWFAVKPNWDSTAALGAALVALISTFFLPKKKEISDQSQTVGDNSTGFQAGRDINMR